MRSLTWRNARGISTVMKDPRRKGLSCVFSAALPYLQISYSDKDTIKIIIKLYGAACWVDGEQKQPRKASASLACTDGMLAEPQEIICYCVAMCLLDLHSAGGAAGQEAFSCMHHVEAQYRSNAECSIMSYHPRGVMGSFGVLHLMCVV